MARLNDLELDAVYERWLKDPNGEKTSVHDIYKLTCAAEAEKGGYPADRRTELLELASRMVASPWKEAWETGTIRGELNRTTEEKRKAVFELVARDSTLMAAAIIAEVNRVSGEVSHGR